MTSTKNKVVGNYELEESIGTGSFSSVYRGTLIRSAQNADHNLEPVVAVKVIHLNRLIPKLKQAMFDEVKILSELHHENVVQLFSSLTSTHNLYLFMEYCGGGDLSKFIAKYKQLPLVTCQHFLRELAHGLEFLFQRDLIHRDLKPQNLLLESWSSTSRLKIADFGFARHLGEAKLAQTMCGSPLYMCPELLAHQNYDSKCDLWSTGIILFEMFVGRTPFQGGSPQELLTNIQRTTLKVPNNVDTNPAAVELMQALLKKNPTERMGFKDFFAAKFVHMTISSSTTTTLIQQQQQQQEALFEEGDEEIFVDFHHHEDAAWEFVERPLRLLLPTVSAKSTALVTTTPNSTRRNRAWGRAATFAIEVSKRGVTLAKRAEQIGELYAEFDSHNPVKCCQAALSVALVVEAIRILVLACAAAEDAGDAQSKTRNTMLVNQIKQWIVACQEKAHTLLLQIPTSREEDAIPNPKMVMFRVALGLGARCASREVLLLPDQSEERALIAEDYSFGLMLLQILCTNSELKKEERTQVLGFVALFCGRLQGLL